MLRILGAIKRNLVAKTNRRPKFVNPWSNTRCALFCESVDRAAEQRAYVKTTGTLVH
jgi:hypothetical protein